MTSYILVLEDDEALGYIYKNRLEMLGYEVYLTTRAEEAMIRIRKRIPALILMDLMMPGTSGQTLLKQLNESTSIAAIPVIVVSAIEDEKVENQPNVTHYFIKGRVGLDDLAAAVEQIIGS